MLNNNTNIDKFLKPGSKRVEKGYNILEQLAKLPTRPIIEGFNNKNNPKDTYNKKAKAKDYTQRINGPLCYLNSPIHKTYARAYHCNNVLKYDKMTNKITARYCNSRTCIICNRIRTAKLVKGYLKPLQDLMDLEPDKQLEFVTLTIPNINKEDLEYERDKMAKNLTNIIRVLNEKRGMDISGIKRSETTYNSIEDNYHPHYHLIVNKNAGKIIIEEWLKRYPEAKHWCQDTRKISDFQKLYELFKYTTKFFMKDKKSGKLKIYTQAIDVIMQSQHKKRTVQPFGKLKKLEEKVSEEVEELISEELDKIYNLEHNAEIIWDLETKNYYIEYIQNNVTKSVIAGSHRIFTNRIKTGIPFTNYEPPDENNFEIYY
jgi:hypothetical protein